MKHVAILYSHIWLCSCATTSTSKEVKKDSKEKLDLPVIYYAKAEAGKGDYFINLRTNKFFDYHEGNDLYAGIYSIEGTTLNLAFNNNNDPDDLSGKATINLNKKEIVLLGKTAASNRRMIITNPE